MMDRTQLEERRRSLRVREDILDQAGNVASGMGEYALANRIWSLVARLKAERVSVNTELCKLDNPNYPGKKAISSDRANRRIRQSSGEQAVAPGRRPGRDQRARL